MWLIFEAVLSLAVISAQSPAVQEAPPVHVKVSAPASDVHAGDTVIVNVEFEVSDGWHVYSNQPAQIGKPTKIDLQLPPGFTAGEPKWPQAEAFEEAGFKYTGYTKRFTVSIPVTVPKDAAGSVEMAVQSSWLACHDECVPGKDTQKVVLNVVAQVQASAPAHTPFDVVYYMLLAALGGVILNLMPCVLPVVSLKILSFARQAGEDKSAILKLGLAYAVGTIASFTVLAGVLIALQQFGIAVGWGFHFQQPIFVLGMMSLIAVMAVAMFGVLEITVSGNDSLTRLSQKESWKGAFFTGVLATLLSTPCTAPFLGTALGFALTQHWLVILLIFISIGVGLSAPYVVLSWKPAWVKLLPKPGNWMVRFKEAMGFAMLLTVAWLFSVLVAQRGAAVVLPAMLWLVVLAFDAWLIGSFAPLYASTRRRRLTWLATIVLTALAGWLLLPSVLTAPNPDATAGSVITKGEAYSPEALQRHLAAGDVVVLDFTAQWCLTCKVYEQTVLETTEVQAALKTNGAVVLRCDWTNGDPAITAKLREFGRSGVPLYVVYSPHRPNAPQVLPDLLTRALLIDAVEAARKP